MNIVCVFCSAVALGLTVYGWQTEDYRWGCMAWNFTSCLQAFLLAGYWKRERGY